MARDFDGTNQYLNSTTTPVNDVPFTMSARFYPQVASANLVIMSIYDFDAAGNGQTHRLQLRGANDNIIAISVADATTAFSEYTASQPTQNAWNHAMGVWTSDTSRLVYLNGSAGTEDTTDVDPTGIDQCAAATYYRQSALGELYFNGYLAEMAIWTAALTGAEASILALGYSPLLVRPQSLVAHWPIIGRTSPEIDIVGGYDMTLANAPTVAAHPPVRYPSRQIYTPSTDRSGPQIDIRPQRNYIQVV